MNYILVLVQPFVFKLTMMSDSILVNLLYGDLSISMSDENVLLEHKANDDD